MTGIAGALAQQRARSLRLLADATRVASAHEMREAPTVPVDGRPALPVVLLPANTRPVVPLPDDARAAFLRHLAVLVEAGDAQPLRDERASPAVTAPASHAPDRAALEGAAFDVLSPAMIAASCATCGGACCTAGGTHAFLRADALNGMRARATGSAVDDASGLLALYAGYLPERHYQDSCVFHAELGCALPRALRSDLCNRHLCGELGQLRRALDEAGERAAYVAAATRTKVQRVVLLAGDEEGRCVRVEVAEVGAIRTA